MDSYTTTSPGFNTIASAWLAAINGLRSGRLAASMGVGTVTMYTVQLRRSCRSLLNRNRGEAASSFASTSLVLSKPTFSASIRAALISKPTVSMHLPNSTASGSPT